MSKDTRFVVFFPGIGTNTQHYFRTYEDAEHYCNNVSAGAYDLGYLLRKLPYNIKGSKFDLFVNNHDQWIAGYGANELDEDFMPGYWKKDDTPEDAAAKLAIKLFEKGILKHE